MTITVETAKLVDVLGDALQTANDFTGGGVHLATHRAPYLDEPGDTDLLALTSTTGSVVGHTWLPVIGQIQGAVWPCGAAKTAKVICESLKKKSKEHTVDIDMVRAEPAENAPEDEHPGWIVTLSETPALFDSDTEFQFHAHPESKFPLAGVGRILAGESKSPEDYEEVPLTSWPPAVLGSLVSVAKSRGEALRFFRSPARRLQLVQIGLTWLGAATPSEPMPGDPLDGPSSEPVFGDCQLMMALRNGGGEG